MEPEQSPHFAKTTIRGSLWTYAAFYSGKLMVFVSSVVLARLLLREEFGVVGYALIVINFLDVLSDLGVGPALIYHREDKDAPNTAFWLGLGMGMLLFGVSWAVAPFVGDFFNDERAVPIMRAMALTFPISALKNVHESLLRKQLAFKRGFIPDVSQAIGKGVISIAAATLGYGAWSLVFGQVGGVVLSVLVYWWASPWRPSFRFAPGVAQALLSYGLSTVALNVVATVLVNIDYLFVGRFLGATALGVYTLAFRVPQLLIIQFCQPISRVMFPMYSKMQNDPQGMSHGFLMTMRYIAIVTVPMGLGLVLVAEPFTLTMYGERWADAIPVTRAIAIYSLALSLTYNAGDVFKAQGKVNILTGVTLLRAVVLIPALWWAATQVGTIEAVGWVHAFIACITGGGRLVVASQMLHIPLRRVVEALRPTIISGTLMVVAVLGVLIGTASAAPVIQLIASVVVGAFAYVAALWWLQRDIVLNATNTVWLAFSRR